MSWKLAAGRRDGLRVRHSNAKRDALALFAVAFFFAFDQVKASTRCATAVSGDALGSAVLQCHQCDWCVFANRAPCATARWGFHLTGLLYSPEFPQSSRQTMNLLCVLRTSCVLRAYWQRRVGLSQRGGGACRAVGAVQSSLDQRAVISEIRFARRGAIANRAALTMVQEQPGEYPACGLPSNQIPKKWATYRRPGPNGASALRECVKAPRPVRSSGSRTRNARLAGLH